MENQMNLTRSRENKLCISPYFIETGNRKYLVEPYGDIDFVEYKLNYEGRYICTISMNEEGEWELNKEESSPLREKLSTMHSLVRMVGKAIENKISQIIVQAAFSHKLWI